ncbi:hypothetical protein KI387_027216, partial [Taxus chinensis]
GTKDANRPNRANRKNLSQTALAQLEQRYAKDANRSILPEQGTFTLGHLGREYAKDANQP